MFSRMMSGTLALLVCLRSAAGQEGASTISLLERLAAHAAVERSLGSVAPKLRIVIDPMIVHANEAPGGRDSTLRDVTRNAYLTQALQARTAPRDSVIDCTVRPCTLRDADVLVTLAEPVIVGAQAKVTVTTVQQTQRGPQYKTVNVRFVRQGSAWKVVGFEDLGIS